MYQEQLLTSDFGSLKRVLVHPMSGEDRNTLPFLPGTNLPGFTSDIMGSDSIREHQLLSRLLRTQGVQVLEVPFLINEAIGYARERGKLTDFIDAYFPKLLPFLENGGDITVADLLGASSRTIFSDGQSQLFRTRDPCSG